MSGYLVLYFLQTSSEILIWGSVDVGVYYVVSLLLLIRDAMSIFGAIVLPQQKIMFYLAVICEGANNLSVTQPGQHYFVRCL